MNIKKGDTVKISAGKNRGKTGKVLYIFPERNRVTVEGINLYKKHVRPKRQGEKGEVVEVARPINSSNVSVVCPSCGKPTRIGRKREKKNVIRICKKCDSAID